MLECLITTDGNLQVSADDETRDEIRDMQEQGRDYWAILAEIFEPLSCNGSFTPFDGGEGNPFVGLTSAPCIAECLNYDDDGKAEIEGRFWYSANYALINELDELANKGVVYFMLAR